MSAITKIMSSRVKPLLEEMLLRPFRKGARNICFEVSRRNNDATTDNAMRSYGKARGKSLSVQRYAGRQGSHCGPLPPSVVVPSLTRIVSSDEKKMSV